MPPLALYVHLPWCERKCPYCDFNSHALDAPVPEADYLQALSADLAAEQHHTAGRPVTSIFIGGGTPSLFSPRAIGEILEAIDGTLGMSTDVEITLEANPGSAEATRFAGYHAAGVNRLSIGVQSFNDHHLKALGRIHDGREACNAIEAARRAGFERINGDLMFGLPGQNPEQAVADIDTLLELGLYHVSHYELTLEPNTVFHARPPELPDPDTRWEMQLACRERLERAGLQRYEISAWASPGQACRHNLNYWRFGDYAAIGAGAHGKLTLPGEAGVWRYHKHRIPQRYMALAGEAARNGWRRLAAEDLRFEFMLNALRLPEGFDESLFRERTGLDPSCIRGELAALAKDGLMECLEDDIRRWRPTGRGLDLLNELQGRFLPEAA